MAFLVTFSFLVTEWSNTNDFLGLQYIFQEDWYCELMWSKATWKHIIFHTSVIQLSTKINTLYSSVQFSHSVVSDSLQPHESQHTRPTCPSPTPRVHPSPCPSSRWCHPAISSSIIPCSSCPQSLPASGSFPWVNPSHEVAQVLEFQLQHQSFQWTPRTDLL